MKKAPRTARKKKTKEAKDKLGGKRKSQPNNSGKTYMESRACWPDQDEGDAS